MNLPVTPASRRFSGILYLLCLLSFAGCGKFGTDSPRSAWQRAMSAYAERNYGALWDTMSDDSRQDTIRVLSHVKQDPKYREVMRLKFNISEDILSNILPREFFIALMTGVERASPKMIELRAHTARTAEFVSEKIEGNKALVSWTSPLGGAESMTFVLEENRWKPIIERRAAAPGSQ